MHQHFPCTPCTSIYPFSALSYVFLFSFLSPCFICVGILSILGFVTNRWLVHIGRVLSRVFFGIFLIDASSDLKSFLFAHPCLSDLIRFVDLSYLVFVIVARRSPHLQSSSKFVISVSESFSSSSSCICLYPSKSDKIR